VTATAVEFDPFSSDYFDDPSEVYRRLRDEAPVYFNEKYGFYALSRHADVVAAHRDWKGFSSTHGVDLASLTKDPSFLSSLEMIIMMDPPEHDRLRALVSRVFTPRAVAALEPMVREVISGLLTPLEGRDTFDLVEEFSGPFPVEIISRMLGVPEGERQQIREWLDVSLHREPGEMDPTPEGATAYIEMAVYFLALTQQKRNESGGRGDDADDMLSRLTQVTVTKLVGNAAVLFSDHPEQWDRVCADPSLIPGAVEEILRILPPSQYQGRFSMEDREFEGGTIPAGFPVLLLTGAATRDPRAFENPDEFDIDRPPSVAIGFGHGVHSCLGAALARMESRIAIEELAKRWRRLEVQPEGLRRVHMSNVAGYSNVPVLAEVRSS
jgi:cytochrome P450